MCEYVWVSVAYMGGSAFQSSGPVKCQLFIDDCLLTAITISNNYRNKQYR